MVLKALNDYAVVVNELNEVRGTVAFLVIIAGFFLQVYLLGLRSLPWFLLIGFLAGYAYRRFKSQPLNPIRKEAGVFITGCSTGIGRHAALHLSKQGMLVFAGVRSMEQGQELLKACNKPENIIPIIIDVTNRVQIGDAVSTISAELEKRNGYLLGLVNNAGISNNGPLELTPIENIRYQFEVNVFGAIVVTQAFLPLFRKSPAGVPRRIIFISSVLGFMTDPAQTLYSASKHALEAVVDGFRLQLKRWEIEVIDILPGPIESNFRATSMQNRVGVIEAAKHSLGTKLFCDMPTVDIYEVATTAAMKKVTPAVETPMYVTNLIERGLRAKKPQRRYYAGPKALILSVLYPLVPEGCYDFLFTKLSGR